MGPRFCAGVPKLRKSEGGVDRRAKNVRGFWRILMVDVVAYESFARVTGITTVACIRFANASDAKNAASNDADHCTATAGMLAARRPRDGGLDDRSCKECRPNRYPVLQVTSCADSEAIANGPHNTEK
jgi:hypothetical protein